MAAATVSLNQALDTLKSMFPEKDRDLIEYVLRQHRGEMEATTEALLQMEETSLPPGVSVGQQRRKSTRQVVVPGSDRQWRQLLPADFLKIPGTLPVLASDARQSRPSVSRQGQQPMVADPGALSDRELEALFQDENFVRAIQDDPELRQYVQAEQAFFQHRTQGTLAPRALRPGQHLRHGADTPQPAGNSTSGWKSFKSGLSSMGAGISSKFNSIARSFNKGGQQNTGSDAQYSSLLASGDSPDTGIELDTLDDDSSAPSSSTSRSQRPTASQPSTSTSRAQQPASAPAFAIGGSEEDDEVGEQGSFLGSDHLASRQQPLQ